MQKKNPIVPTAEKATILCQWLDEHKAQHIITLDIAAQNCFAECLIIVTARSIRHAQSLAEGLAAWCKHQQFEFLRMEGKQAGQWILLDLNDIVVNIFQEPVRDVYRLESLWGHTPKPIQEAQA